MREAQSASLEVVFVALARACLGTRQRLQRSLDVERAATARGRWRLEVLNRRGYGKSPPPEVRSDFEEDARDIAALLGDDAHLVGHLRCHRRALCRCAPAEGCALAYD